MGRMGIDMDTPRTCPGLSTVDVDAAGPSAAGGSWPNADKFNTLGGATRLIVELKLGLDAEEPMAGLGGCNKVAGRLGCRYAQ